MPKKTTKEQEGKEVKAEKKESVKKPKKTLAKADRPVEKESPAKTSASHAAAQSQDYRLPTGKYSYANGKRKTSIARVRLYKGDGSIFINQKPINKFCTAKIQSEVIKSPLKLLGLLDKFTITVVVSGGGTLSQADAIRHGIAKAITIFDPSLRPTLRHAGFLTRDPRSKERKKFGFRGSRRGRQFSKR